MIDTTRTEATQTDTAQIGAADVPDVAPDAVVDPHFLDLVGGSTLPSLYMPPSMPGRHSTGLRVVALVLVGIFVAATACGVCLTYGAPHHIF